MTYPIDLTGIPSDLSSRVLSALNEAAGTGLAWDRAVAQVAKDTQDHAARQGFGALEAWGLGRFVHAFAETMVADLASSIVSELTGCEIRTTQRRMVIEKEEGAALRSLLAIGRMTALSLYASVGTEAVAGLLGKALIESDDRGLTYKLSRLGRAVASAV